MFWSSSARRQVKQSIPVTINCAPIAALETCALCQFDPVRHPARVNEITYRRRRALELFVLRIFLQRGIDAVQRAIGGLDFLVQARPLLRFMGQRPGRITRPNATDDAFVKFALVPAGSAPSLASPVSCPACQRSFRAVQKLAAQLKDLQMGVGQRFRPRFPRPASRLSGNASVWEKLGRPAVPAAGGRFKSLTSLFFQQVTCPGAAHNHFAGKCCHQHSHAGRQSGRHPGRLFCLQHPPQHKEELRPPPPRRQPCIQRSTACDDADYGARTRESYALWSLSGAMNSFILLGPVQVGPDPALRGSAGL